jgi:hypothetical protein
MTLKDEEGCLCFITKKERVYSLDETKVVATFKLRDKRRRVFRFWSTDVLSANLALFLCSSLFLFSLNFREMCCLTIMFSNLIHFFVSFIWRKEHHLSFLLLSQITCSLKPSSPTPSSLLSSCSRVESHYLIFFLSESSSSWQWRLTVFFIPWVRQRSGVFISQKVIHSGIQLAFNSLESFWILLVHQLCSTDWTAWMMTFWFFQESNRENLFCTLFLSLSSSFSCLYGSTGTCVLVV